MTTLTANLKHFYQCRCGWFWYLIILAQLPNILLMKGSNLSFLIISFFGGILVSNIQKEILTKQFSFCLPGHVHMPRRLCFWVGVIINGLLGLILLFNPAVGLRNAFFVVIAGGVMGMLIYLIAVSLNFFDVEHDKLLGVGLFVASFFIVGQRWDRIILRMTFSNPLIVIIPGILLCWYFWQRLDGMTLRRRYCGKVIQVGMFDGLNKQRIERLKQARFAKIDEKDPNLLTTSSAVDSFFFSRIEDAKSGSLGQYIWGSLYKTFGITMSKRPKEHLKVFLILLACLCFLSYMPGKIHNIIFFLPGAMILNMDLWVHSSLSIAGGRRERFWSALTLALLTGVVATAGLMVFVFVSFLLENIMPQLRIIGQDWIFKSIGTDLLFVPFLIVPFVLAISQALHKKPILKVFLLMGIFQLFFLTFFVGRLAKLDSILQAGSVMVNPLMVVGLGLLSWGIFVGVLRYVSMRRCLV